MSKTEVKPHAKIMDVSPHQAQIWMLKNVSNRPKSRRGEKYLTEEIRKNKWELQTDGIGFDTEGKLINGQTRLQAIIDSGKTVPLVVVTGLNPDAFNVIDTVRVRSSGDVLAAHGMGAAHHKSAIVKFVVGFKKGLNVAHGKAASRRDMNMSNQDVLDYAEKHLDKLDEAYEVSVRTTKSFKGLKARIVGGLYWILSDIGTSTSSRDYALQFFHQLSTGIALKNDDPIYVLREKLISDLGNKKKFPERDKLAWVILTWNHFRKGNKLKKIQWNGDATTAFPKPI